MKRLFSQTPIIIITGIFLIFIEYYCFSALKIATKNINQPLRIAIFILYYGITLFVIWSIFNFRAIDDNHFPTWVKTISSPLMLGLTFGKLLIGLIMFGGDIYRFIHWFIHLGMNHGKEVETNAVPRSQFLAQTALFTGGIIISGFAYGMRNKYRYNVKRVKIKLPEINKGLAGLKVVQLSDIHAGSFDDPEAVRNGMKTIMKQGADLILFTGDIVNNRQEELNDYLEIFSSLSAPLGVFAVLGNHDYGDYVSWSTPQEKANNLNILKSHFKSMNWQLLNNEHRILNYNGNDFALLGVENWSSRANFPKYGILKNAVQGLEDKSELYQILMSHDPSHWDSEVLKNNKDINLTLSGHTHGMQFGINIPKLKWSPVQYVYNRWNGLYDEDNQSLYVNPGFGFIGYKGRVGILPEITVFEFV